MGRYLNSKTIFLLDGVGALISLLALGLLLPAFQSYIGMPIMILYGLATLALTFAVYSLSCYQFADHSNPIWLKLIICANLSYCLISLACIFVFFEDLTWLGLTYFVAEKFIVMFIVFWNGEF